MTMPRLKDEAGQEPELFHQPEVEADRKPAPRKAVDKAPHAYRTISEVAEELDMPQHVLRFWETKFAQLKPLKRAGGRRYYRAEDVTLLREIHALLYGQGYTIKGAQKVLKGGKASRPAEKTINRMLAPPPAPRVALPDREVLVEMLHELKALRALV